MNSPIIDVLEKYVELREINSKTKLTLEEINQVRWLWNDYKFEMAKALHNDLPECEEIVRMLSVCFEDERRKKDAK